MTTNAPITIIEPDDDDREILEIAFQEANIDIPRIYFRGSEDFLEYLNHTADKPLLVLCEVHLDKVDGLALLTFIETDAFLRKKSIPFIFMTTAPNPTIVNEAYLNHIVQGFFSKKATIASLVIMLKTTVSYWQMCEQPFIEQTTR
jgi:DNA-binding NtrC family response regulator